MPSRSTRRMPARNRHPGASARRPPPCSMIFPAIRFRRLAATAWPAPGGGCPTSERACPTFDGVTATKAANGVQLARVAAAVWIAAAVAYLVVEKVAADHVKGHYSYLHHYISVLGVPDWGRFAYLMNGAFYVQGALLFVGAVLVTRASGRRGLLFLLFTAAATTGYFFVATVHGGSPLARGDGMQLHMIGALLVFIAGNLAIVPGAKIVGRTAGAPWWYRTVSLLI